MRLAKKHGSAVLSIAIALDGMRSGGLGLGIGLGGGRDREGGGGGGGLSVTHDVLVDVLRPADMERLKEPLCPEPDVRVSLPHRIYTNLELTYAYTCTI